MAQHNLLTSKNDIGTIFNKPEFLEIHDRLSNIKSDAQKQWGKMNLVQMLNHLKIATGSALGKYNLKDESSFIFRVIIKFFVIRILKRLPKNAPSPKGFRIEMNDLLDFSKEKQEVLDILEKAYSSKCIAYAHPQFGIMSRLEWGRLVYRHFDHHLRQFNS